MAITTINPATGELLQTFEALTTEQIEAKILRATYAFAAHRRTPCAERARKLLQVAAILDAEQEAFARVMTTEMGKTYTSALAEVAKSATGCRYYAENAERFLADEEIKIDGARSYVRYQPLGPVLAIMPWNFPFWQVFRFAAPALMAGNVGLLKHASNVPQCALLIEDIFRRAGFAEGVFQTLLIGAGQVQPILEDGRIAAATLTGSEGAGRQVASVAGRQIKKLVLELGGSDPFIVMPSADLESAVKTAVSARIVNNGQSCVAAKRFLVAEPIADAFLERFIPAMAALRVGDPMEPTTDVGPLATPSTVADLDKQVQGSVAAGAQCLLGGKRLPGPGNFYAPTVLVDIPQEAPVFAEETFGPVAAVFRVQDVSGAIALANATSFGLGASVWTNDEAEQARFVDEIEAGMVFVNSMVASDPRLPFGGVKHSGYGRELSSHGIYEFVNIKTVSINGRPAPQQEPAPE
ncbi:MAG: NADP-dependent succinic semialdehyde dehydrogenase [Chloroflexi bacterium]|nr:MAG: NADP-dependent succinic semialdehyde dehydrogenase [Chloroflexota bacterium]